MQVRRGSWRPLALLTLLCALLYLPGQATLPPFDRDEARFAQASKQVLQEGRWLVPYFQDAPRSKKPAGIYWLQAGSVAGAQAISGDPATKRAIWAYRVPSVIGAWLAVLLTYAIGRQLFDPAAAGMGAAILASSLLLTVEAHLATTDAVLLATILLAIWGLARAQALWRTGGTPYQSGDRPWLAFWGGLGFSVLIKGPIGPAVVGLAALGQRWASGAWRWGRFLWPGRGVILFAVLAGAWPLALIVTGAGGFMVESANEDLIPKVLSAQESHGAPPGSYLAALYVAFWPGALIVVPGIVAAFLRRDDPGVRFCLAWAVPGWIMFALVPTKLPHYVLPLYPALALLAGHLCSKGWPDARRVLWRWLGWLHVGVWTALGLAMAGAFAVLPAFYAGGIGHWSVIQCALALAAVAVIVGTLRRTRSVTTSAPLTILAAALVFPMLAQVYVPRLDHLFVARTVAERLPPPDERPPLAAAGYHEPSLVFLAGTDTVLTSPAGVAQHLAATPGAYGLLESDQRPAFNDAAGADLAVETILGFPAFNYSKGERHRLQLLHGRPGDGQ